MGIERRRGDQFHTANGSSYGMGMPNRSNQSKIMARSLSWLTDPENKRRKRVAQYNVMTLEGKAKQSVRNSFRWLKAKYIALRYGVW